MKISELSSRSGVAVATIKYYLREDLLPAGRPVATNQADYGDDHVRRLRLIRALIDIGDLAIADVRRVLIAVDHDSLPTHEAFGAVMAGLGARRSTTDSLGVDQIRASVEEVRAWQVKRDWNISPEAPATHQLAELLVTLRDFGIHLPAGHLDTAADVADAQAELEVASARSITDRTAAVEFMLVGTVIIERINAQVRRLALESASAGQREE